MPDRGVRNYVITGHALFEMRRRGLNGEIIQKVLAELEQRIELRPGRAVLQSRLAMGKRDELYLVRVFVDIDRDLAEVITAYRTSKIDKYWRIGP